MIERDEASTQVAELSEALDLLRLWYGRWQGNVSGTPHNMHLRTRALLQAHEGGGRSKEGGPSESRGRGNSGSNSPGRRQSGPGPASWGH